MRIFLKVIWQDTRLKSFSCHFFRRNPFLFTNDRWYLQTEQITQFCGSKVINFKVQSHHWCNLSKSISDEIRNHLLLRQYHSRIFISFNLLFHIHFSPLHYYFSARGGYYNERRLYVKSKLRVSKSISDEIRTQQRQEVVTNEVCCMEARQPPTT